MRGGGIFINGAAAPIIKNCIIENCRANNGGGISILDNNPEEEYEEGDPNAPSVARIEGCTIRGNTADNNGGGFWITNSSPVIVNTIIAHSANLGLKNASPPARVSHVLLFGNGRDGGNTPLDESVVLGKDPLFTNSYELQDGSPAIDRGTLRPGVAYSGDAPDIGAREFWVSPAGRSAHQSR